MASHITIEPLNIVTPGTVYVWGIDPSEFDLIRATAYKNNSTYIGVLADVPVTSGMNYVAIPIDGYYFYQHSVGTNETITLRFSGRYKTGAAAGMYISLPPYETPMYTNVTAGSDCDPIFTGTSEQIIQPQNSILGNTLAEGISKIKLQVHVVARSYQGSLTVSGVLDSISYPFQLVSGSATTYTDSSGHQYVRRTYEATIGPVKYPQARCVVTAKEPGGRSTTYTYTKTGVVHYSVPFISINSCYRCDANGNAVEGGPYCAVNVKVDYDTSISGNSLNKLTLSLNGTDYTLVNNTTRIVSGSLSPNQKYLATITAQDKVSAEVTRDIILPGAVRDLVITRGTDNQGSHASVGMTPSILTGKSTFELPSGGQYVLDGMPYGAFNIPVAETNDGVSFGKNFLNIDLNDRYAEENADAVFYRSRTDASFINAPAAVQSGAFHGWRKVILLNHDFALVILFEAFPTAGRIWINGWFSEWTGWKSLTAT